ncbi:hypothetical protein [Rhodohalobacter sp. 8-1]|uniref:hypothetical protein n=1 Tax=Rhodohalobacter sp. 8-1 TaxID=3131972 RepID=UPI0030EE5E16
MNLRTDLDELSQNSDKLYTVLIGHLFQDEIQGAEAELVLDIEITQVDSVVSNSLVNIITEMT